MFDSDNVNKVKNQIKFQNIFNKQKLTKYKKIVQRHERMFSIVNNTIERAQGIYGFVFTYFFI